MAVPICEENAEAPFRFLPRSAVDVSTQLTRLDPMKSASPDQLELYFKLATDFIVQPLSNLYNPSLFNSEVPSTWKSAFVLPLLKREIPQL